MVIVRIRPIFVVTGESGDELYLKLLDRENKRAYAETWACIEKGANEWFPTATRKTKRKSASS